MAVAPAPPDLLTDVTPPELYGSVEPLESDRPPQPAEAAKPPRAARAKVTSGPGGRSAESAPPAPKTPKTPVSSEVAHPEGSTSEATGAPETPDVAKPPGWLAGGRTRRERSRVRARGPRTSTGNTRPSSAVRPDAPKGRRLTLPGMGSKGGSAQKKSADSKNSKNSKNSNKNP